MATIWEGTHLTLNRPIAIKFIDLVGPNSAKVRDRFLREARVAAAVQHRNVVDIVDFGTTEEGRPFMVMELLVGRTLADRLTDPSPISVGEAVRIIARTLSGLAAVHDAGIVHRDLKPENVFLVSDADGSYPKLLDFGVSRAVDPQGDLKSVLPTVENAIVGTPQYMSPEQARGLSDIDGRSDLWSAGVMLYELLTGELPFDADAVGDIIIQIATAEPPDFAVLRPDLAGPVEQVVKKAMARKPEDRFRTAREMRTALLEAVAKTAVEIQGSSGRRSQVRLETQSDLPPVGAQELMSAVGDAYEPGDSGLIDFSDHLEPFDEGPEPSSGLRPVPPPPRRAAGPDPFGADAPAPETLGADLAEVAPQAPTKGRSRAVWIGLGLALVLAVAGGATLALRGVGEEPMRARPLGEPTVAPAAAGEPAEDPPPSAAAAAAAEPAPAEDAAEVVVEPAAAPEATVSVELRGVPEGAEIRVDGEPVEAPLELPRDGEAHEVEVRTRDGRSWSVSHEASADGSYAVELPTARRRRARRPRPRPRPRTRRESSGLMRDPGF
jgi:serine/threonine-protein kinase